MGAGLEWLPMKIALKSLLVLAVVVGLFLALHHLAGQPRKPREERRARPGIPDGALAEVARVVDGDTVVVRLVDGGAKVTVRLKGIDCPESRWNNKCERDAEQGRQGCKWQVPRGQAASRMAKQILRGRIVRLACGKKCGRGGYGRALRYVELEDGRDYGLEMVRRGLCEDYGFKYPHPRQASYRRVQADAKRGALGIWAD